MHSEYAFPLLISPLLLLLGWLSVRLLYCTFNYHQRKGHLSALPALSDPFLRLKALFVDAVAKLSEEIQAIAGKGNPFLPVVYSGPYLGSPLVLVNSPDLCKEVSNDTLFPKLPIIYDTASFFLGNGIVTAVGEDWKIRRSHLNPLFYSKKLRIFSALIKKNAEAMVEELTNHKGNDVDCVGLFGEVTLKVLIDCLFSGKIDAKWAAGMWEKANTQYTFYEAVLGSTVNSISLWKRAVAQNGQALTLVILSLCREARTNPNTDASQHDFVETLVHMKNEKGAQLISDTEIAEGALIMLFAGHDTTKNAIAWTIFYLAQNQHEMAKLQQEVDRELRGKTVVYDDLPRLQKCKNAFQEAMRLRPTIPLLERIAPQNRTTGPYSIPKGTTLAINIHAVGIDPASWVDPLSFRPDRFDADFANTKHYIPFSLGPRNCIGQKLAILLLASIAQHFDICMGDGKEIPSMEVTYAPTGLKCKFVPRIIFCK